MMPVAIRHTVDQAAIDDMFSVGSRMYFDLVRRGVLVQNAARRNTPVDTGRLRSSIHLEAPIFRDSVVGVRVGTDVEYALPIEFGTRYTRARPFLRPALQAAAG